MNFVVIGAGAWGTAFSLHLVAAGPLRDAVAAAAGAKRPRSRRRARTRTTFRACRCIARASDNGRPRGGPAGRRRRFYRLPRADDARDGPALAKRLRGGPRTFSLVVSLAEGAGTRAPICGRRKSSRRSCPRRRSELLTGPTNAAEIARGPPAAMVLATAGPSARRSAGGVRGGDPATERFGFTRATTSRASNSAGRSRTSTRSPPAAPTGSGWATMPKRRFSPEHWPKWSGWAPRSAPGPKPFTG